MKGFELPWQKDGSHWDEAWIIGSDPEMSITLLAEEPVRLQLPGGGANVRGTVIRLRQLDALHHRLPVTVRSAPSSFWPKFAPAPGWYAPVSSHAS